MYVYVCVLICMFSWAMSRSTWLNMQELVPLRENTYWKVIMKISINRIILYFKSPFRLNKHQETVFSKCEFHFVCVCMHVCASRNDFVMTLCLCMQTSWGRGARVGKPN